MLKPFELVRCIFSIDSIAAGFCFPYASRKKLLDFVSGDGQVSDALELAIMEMKKGEKAGLAMMAVSKEMPQGEGLG